MCLYICLHSKTWSNMLRKLCGPSLTWASLLVSPSDICQTQPKLLQIPRLRCNAMQTWGKKIFWRHMSWKNLLVFIWKFSRISGYFVFCLTGVCGQWKLKTLSKRTKTPAFPLLLGDTFFCPPVSKCNGSGDPKNILHYSSVNINMVRNSVAMCWKKILNVSNQKNHISIF